MSFFSEFWHQPWIETLGWTLLHFLWQGVLIAFGLAIALWILRRASANARYLAGLIALFFAAILPLGTAAWIGWPSASLIESEDPNLAEHTETESPAAKETLPLNAELQPIMESSHPGHVIPDGMTNGPITESTLPIAEKPMANETPLAEQEQASTVIGPTLSDWLRPLLPFAVAQWVLGVAVFSLRLLVTWIRVQRLRYVGVHPIALPLADKLLPLCERLVIRRKVLLFSSWCVEVPTVIGWLKPVILFPMSALAGLSPSQLEALLAHELAHIRRWDYVVNLLQTVIETVLFYHPAVWWISRRVRAERENCCDDWAAKISGDEVGYVRALLHMAELHLAQNPIALAAGDGDLLQRAKRLLSGKREHRFAPGTGGVLLTAVMLCLLAVGLFQIAWAKPAEEQNPAEETQAKTDEGEYKSLTPEKIASEVEDMMRRFSKVSYKATFEETRNANAFMKPEVLPVSGKGNWEYKSDGERWLIRREGFTNSVGSADAIPTQSVAGFDGERFHELDNGRYVIGEDPNSNDLYAPRGVFWNGARTVGWLLAALKSWNAHIDREVTIDGHPCVVLLAEPGQPKPSEMPEPTPRNTRFGNTRSRSRLRNPGCRLKPSSK